MTSTLVEYKVRAEVPGIGNISYNFIFDLISQLSINLSAPKLAVSSFMRASKYQGLPVQALEDLTREYLNELAPDSRPTYFDTESELHTGKEYDSIRTTMAVIAAGHNGPETLDKLAGDLEKAGLRFRKA